MAVSRMNPVSVEVVENYATTIPNQIDKLVKRIEDTDNANAGWTRRQLNYIKARMGKRKQKRVPWVGASNINVPLVDGIIRRWRPGITSLVLDANPVAFFVAREPGDFDPARVVEPFFTWLFVDHMDTPREVSKLVDLVASRGHAYSREGWKYETQRQARVARVEDIFPEGLEAYLQGQAAAVEEGKAAGVVPEDEQIQPEVAVAKRLADEYGMSIQDPLERDQLLQAALFFLNGAPAVKLVYETTKHDRPEWCALDPVNVITERCGDPEKADFFVVIHEMTQDQVRRMAVDGRFSAARVKELLSRVESRGNRDSSVSNRSGGAGGSMARRQIRDYLERRSGVFTSKRVRKEDHLVTLWETYCHLDVNGDGLLERCVVWYSPEHKYALDAREFVLPLETWPVTTFQFEAHAESPTDSRGIPELLAELHKLVNAFHNARIDASQIILAPVMQRRATAGDYAQSIQWRPGGVVNVQQVGDIAPIPQDLNILVGLLQEEQNEQRIAESFIGTFDATINQLNQPTERRTATEVSAITQLAQNVFGLDARMFQVSMARSFRKIWQLWLEYGPEETFFRVTGEQQPRLARKSELTRNYDITPAGTPSSTNKAFLMASMERVLQIIINDVSGRFDVGALLESYFKLIDLNLAKMVVRTPEQTQAAQAVMAAAQQVTGEQLPI